MPTDEWVGWVENGAMGSFLHEHRSHVGDVYRHGHKGKDGHTHTVAEEQYPNVAFGSEGYVEVRRARTYDIELGDIITVHHGVSYFEYEIVDEFASDVPTLAPLDQLTRHFLTATNEIVSLRMLQPVMILRRIRDGSPGL